MQAVYKYEIRLSGQSSANLPDTIEIASVVRKTMALDTISAPIKCKTFETNAINRMFFYRAHFY